MAEVFCRDCEWVIYFYAMKKLQEIDIIDSIKIITQNADNTEFITKTINDIYQLGYNHGYADAETYFSNFFDHYSPKIERV